MGVLELRPDTYSFMDSFTRRSCQPGREGGGRSECSDRGDDTCHSVSLSLCIYIYIYIPLIEAALSPALEYQTRVPSQPAHQSQSQNCKHVYIHKYPTISSTTCASHHMYSLTAKSQYYLGQSCQNYEWMSQHFMILLYMYISVHTEPARG